MTKNDAGEFEALWESAGRRAAVALDDTAAVAVVGDDPIATASVALGIGRMQALKRRVAVGDLIGDVPPLYSLVSKDDPHGIVDSFVYGVSLNRIARPADKSGNLHVLPSGSDSVVQEEIFQNPRWRRLASGFRESGALLVLAAPATVPGIKELIGSLDGVVLVGGVANPAPGAPVLGDVRVAPRRQTPKRLTPRIAPEVGAARPARSASTAAADARRWLFPLIGVGAVAAATAVVLFGRGSFFTGADSDRVDAASDSAAGATAPPADTTIVVSAPALVPSNPGDSLAAATFAVEILSANTERGATMKLEESGAALPASTYSPLLIGGDRAQWFRVFAGAYTERAPADSLLRALRISRIVPAGSGSVVRAPLALLLSTAADADAAPAVLDTYRSRGVPAYALLQSDGTVRVYSGAFSNRDEASLMASTLRNAKIDATLAYRVGRPL